MKTAAMQITDHHALELQIRRLCETGDKKQAATLLLSAYGVELLGFLISRLRDRDAAQEVFSRFCEDLWRGLDGFGWRCSIRAWSYTLARHAASHYVRESQRRRARQLPLSALGPPSEIADKPRSATLQSARNEVKSELVKLRERLPPDDQTLLILRVNRRMSWPEIAQIMLRDGVNAERPVLEREAMRLRKRYQMAKDKLRKMAREAGLIEALERS
jgi:RNA polymerase sigma-70 factor (ECF subfamily)